MTTSFKMATLGLMFWRPVINSYFNQCDQFKDLSVDPIILFIFRGWWKIFRPSLTRGLVNSIEEVGASIWCPLLWGFITFPFYQACLRNKQNSAQFLTISRALHFGRNLGESLPIPSNPLYKISPFLNLYRKNIEETYYPSKNLCIDESLVFWRGRMYFRQLKKLKYGIKLCSLC